MSTVQTHMPRVIGFGLACAALLLATSAHAKPKNPKANPPPPAAAPANDKPAASETRSDLSPVTAQPTPAASSEAKPALTITPATAPAKASEASSEAPAATSGARAAKADDEKLTGLRADVTTLMDDLVEARSRAALLGKTLFKTQVRVRVQNLAAPDPVLSKIVLKLDGAPIFRGDGSALTDDPRQVFQGFIAPGAHVLSVEVEQQSRDDAAYGYGLRNSYRFSALREKRSDLTLVLDDDSDLASEFPDDGEYDVRTRLKVFTKDLTEE